MRDIKFRVWDARHQKFFIPADIANNIASSSSDGDKKLMQYTGLKDKNGKEIYEADILKYSEYVDHGQWGETVKGGIVLVTWLEEHAGFYPFYVWSSYNDQLKTCEVIGNIYENPELLTK